MAIVHKGSAAGSLFGRVITVPAPAGMTPGNLVVVTIGCQADYVASLGWPSSAQVATPSGWTLQGQTEWYALPGPGLVFYLFTRFVQEGETGWQFVIVNRSVDPLLYAVSAWAGVDTTTPVETTPLLEVNTPAAADSTSSGLTTTHANTALLCFFLVPVDAGAVPTFSTPSGMTARASAAHDTNGGGLALFSQAIAATGATSSRKTNLSATVESIAAAIALRPDQSTPTAQPSSFTIGCRFHAPTFAQAALASPVDDLLAYPDDSLVRVVARIKRRDLDSEAELEQYAATAVPTSHTFPAGTTERLVDDLEITRSIFGDGVLGGEGSLSVGELSVLNGDAAADAYGAASLDSRDVDLWVGGINPHEVEVDFADYLHWIRLRGVAPSLDLDAVHVALEDGSAILDRNLQLTKYAGTGGDEGGDDLKGIPKPIGLGTVYNAEPRVLSQVPLRYQFHDGTNHGAARALLAVYDSGILLSPDLYDVDLSAGTFDLLTNPAGRITCDFLGPLDAGDSGPELVKWLTSDVGAGPLTFPNDFDNDAWLDFEAADTYARGLYVRDEAKIRDLVTKVLAPLGWRLPSRLGRHMFGVIAPPAGTPDLDIQPWMVRGLRQLATRRPYSRVSLGYARNWTKQDAGELAGTAVASERGLFAVEEYRTVSYPAAEDPPDPAVLDAYPSAEEAEMLPTLLVYKEDAEAALASYWDVYGKPWRLFETELGLQTLRTDVGRVQRLTYTQPHPTDHDATIGRFELGSGELLRALLASEKSAGGTLLLWSTRDLPTAES